ncbi:MAG: dicarboxylate/amino acid:cation symporter [Fimbriimonadaceae bacterium]
MMSLVVGAIVGVIANVIAASNPAFKETLGTINDKIMGPVGSIFLAMIFMIVVPLLLSAIVLGVGEIGEVRKFGRIGGRTLIMTVVFSGIAVALAMIAVNLVNPGRGISEEKRDTLVAQYKEDADKKYAAAEAPEPPDPPVLGIVPKNPILEASRALSGGILPFMFFAIIFGLAMTKVDSEVVAPLRQFFEAVFEVSQKVIDMAMTLAPIGVFALIFKTGSSLGFDIFILLLKYAVLVLVVLAIHMFGVYSLLIKFIAKRNPMDFFRQCRNVMITAFATSSSNATLPVALRDAEKEVGLPKDISSFILTVGATANQNGTALFEGITIIFLCQLFGVELGMADQLKVLGLAIVAGIGTAGVPGGAWPVIGAIVKGFKVPGEAIGIVLGIDRLLDMSRTVLNVVGDMAIACCVSEWEGRGVAIPEEVQG